MESKVLCPFKKRVHKETNPMTGVITTHEWFEECAKKRCMAYRNGKCLRLECANNRKDGLHDPA